MTVDHERVVMADYISGTLTKLIVRINVEMLAAASHTLTCTADSFNWANSEDIDWTYKVYARRDSGAETLLKTVTASHSASYSASESYAGGSPGVAAQEINYTDSVSVGGHSWTGSYSKDFANMEPTDLFQVPLKTGTPADSDVAEVGLGSWSQSCSGSPPSCGSASVSGWGFQTFYVTPHYFGDTLLTIGAPGIPLAELTLDATTNNIRTLKLKIFDPTESTEWGPCWATNAIDSNVLTATDHWASYHPEDEDLQRSTTTQLCWL